MLSYGWTRNGNAVSLCGNGNETAASFGIAPGFGWKTSVLESDPARLRRQHNPCEWSSTTPGGILSRAGKDARLRPSRCPAGTKRGRSAEIRRDKKESDAPPMAVTYEPFRHRN